MTGLIHMSDGKPVRLTAPKLTIVTCAIVAFSVLVTMFHREQNSTGVAVCVANLGLRLIEALRVMMLHQRSTVAAVPINHHSKLLVH